MVWTSASFCSHDPGPGGAPSCTIGHLRPKSSQLCWIYAAEELCELGPKPDLSAPGEKSVYPLNSIFAVGSRSRLISMPYRYLHGNEEWGQRSTVYPSCDSNDQKQCIKECANVVERLLGFSLPEVQTADFLCAIISNTSINPFDKHNWSPKVTTFHHSYTVSVHASHFSASHPN